MTTEAEFTLIGDKDTDEHFNMHGEPPEIGELKLMVESGWAEDNQATFILWIRGQQNDGDDLSMNFSTSEDHVVFFVAADDDTPFEYAQRVCDVLENAFAQAGGTSASQVECKASEDNPGLITVSLEDGVIEQGYLGIKRLKKDTSINPTFIPIVTPTIEPTPIVPTITPTPTPSPNLTPTPISTQTPTPTPGETTPDISLEFETDTLSGNQLAEIPGGFRNAPGGEVETGVDVQSDIPSSSDGAGLSITVAQDEVGLLYMPDAIESEYPVLLRLTLSASASNASVVLGALKGSLQGQTADGSIAMDNPLVSEAFVDEEGALVLVYEPDVGNVLTPFIQVSSSTPDSSDEVIVKFDRLEGYIIDEDFNIRPGLFRRKME